MKKRRKLPVFLELTFGSLAIISTILIVFMLIQLVSLNFLSIDYQKKSINIRYEEINYLVSNTDQPYYDTINKLPKNKNEHIRIYSNDTIKFATPSQIWKPINLRQDSLKAKTSIKFIRFNRYVILDAPIKIDNKDYKIQIVQGISIPEEFVENYFHTFIFVLLVGVVLSVLGAIYVSKRFLSRLKILTTTMKEVKEKGIKQRIPISEAKDDFDKVNIEFNSMMDDLEKAFDEQNQFVSDASHELRTPLTVLQGHLNLLNRWGKNDKDTLDKSLNICLSEVERLKKIVNDLLQLFKTDREDFDATTIEPIRAYEIIINTIENYELLHSNIEFKTNIDKDIKIKIMEEHLKQLLIIFIDNAIKYNDKETIKIDIGLNLKNNHFYLDIKDNGMGILKEEIPKVTNRFYKVDKSRVNKDKSFGLGLSIARNIVESYNGKISILSELKEGTEIIVTI